MIDKQERSVLFKSMARVVKQYVADRVHGLEQGLESFEKRLTELPIPKDGLNGRDGLDGKDGAPGKDGERGADGINGKDGTAGLNGKDGEIGPVGPKGEKGDPGERGEKGERGERGETGPPGIQGERGLDGLASDGKDGRDGRDGINGKDGSPGRDALQIDILPSVDFAKAYPRGTFARHDGGLIRAFRDTIPGDSLESCGFEVILNGFGLPEFIQGENERQIICRVKMTSGIVIGHHFSFPMMIYRGIWRETEQYSQGDMLTFGGSVWHCNVTGTKAKPGTETTDWTLAVKEGRRGKDGENGRDYTPPQPIKLNGR